MNDNNQWQVGDGRAERIRFVAAGLLIFCVIVGLWYVFSVVDPLALAIMAVIGSIAVVFLVRFTRNDTRKEDVEIRKIEQEAFYRGQEQLRQMYSEAIQLQKRLMDATGVRYQLPAPQDQKKATDGSGSFPIYNNGKEVEHPLQPPRGPTWMYRLPDSREARGDLVEGIIEHGWDEYDSGKFGDFRTYLRACGLAFSNASYRSAYDALEQEGLVNAAGNLITRQDEAERIIERMRARAR